MIFQQSSIICIGRHVGGHTKENVRFPEKAWSEDAATLAGKTIKIEQVSLSARLTREDKVMLSSFRKTVEVLLD